MLKQKNILLFIISFIYSVGVYAAQEEAPKIVLFFGRFHPLLLHLPIGALLLTFFMEIVGRIRKNEPHIMIVNALAFSAFFSVTTAIMGYFLSLEGGYGTEVLQIHMYAGFGMALLTCLLYVSKKNEKGHLKKAYIPLYIITLLVTIVAGHYGSVLTHGDDFLTEYSPLESDADQELILDVDSLYYYKNVVVPIIEDRCIQCHNSNKTKGELNLSTSNHINKGGENGKIIEIGNSLESSFYTSLMLPFEEDEHMPPTGKPQLTTSEIWLLKYWIDEGADYKKQLVNYKDNDTLSKLLKGYLVLPKQKIDDASSKDIENLAKYGFTMRKLVYGEPYLSATYSNKGKQISKKAMKALSNISDQLVELNLQESKISDELSENIAQLKSLRILRLDKTVITDNSLVHLKNLDDLEILNLFNTNVTNRGLSELLSVIKLKKVYFGNEDQQALKADYTDKEFKETTVSQGLQDNFLERVRLEKPIIVGMKSFFKKDVKIEVKTRLKNENIFYTLDGKTPDSTSLVYSEPIVITESSLFKTKTYKEKWYPSDVVERAYSKVKFEIDKISIKYPQRDLYAKVSKLIDLEKGSDYYKDGNWVGFHNDLVATLDLGVERTFSQLAAHCLENVDRHVFYPLYIEVYVGNEPDLLKQVGELKLPPSDRKTGNKIKSILVNFEQVSARYIKVIMKTSRSMPKWHARAGQDSYIYLDEIMVTK